MAKVKRDVDVIVSAAFYGVELDIPDDVLAAGKEAEVNWIKSNTLAVDFAKVDHTETCVVSEVTAVR